jgi:hypothetical protein
MNNKLGKENLTEKAINEKRPKGGERGSGSCNIWGEECSRDQI